MMDVTINHDGLKLHIIVWNLENEPVNKKFTPS